MPVKKISPYEIIKMLQTLPEDKPINKRSLKEYSKLKQCCHPDVISRMFGSIKEACKLANVRCDVLSEEEKIKKMNLRNTIWNREKIVECIKKLPEKYEDIQPQKIPIYSKNGDICSAEIIRKHFGSVTTAFEHVGVNYINMYWTQEQVIYELKKANEKYGPLTKDMIRKNINDSVVKCSRKTIIRKFITLEKAAELAGFKFVEPQEVGNKFNGKIGKNETKILDEIEQKKKIKLFRQFPVKMGDITYNIDGYDLENNVAYEIDGKDHNWRQFEDEIRESVIKQKLGCTFIRVNENN